MGMHCRQWCVNWQVPLLLHVIQHAFVAMEVVGRTSSVSIIALSVHVTLGYCALYKCSYLLTLLSVSLMLGCLLGGLAVAVPLYPTRQSQTAYSVRSAATWGATLSAHLFRIAVCDGALCAKMSREYSTHPCKYAWHSLWYRLQPGRPRLREIGLSAP